MAGDAAPTPRDDRPDDRDRASSEDLRRTAAAISRRVQPEDPRSEPPNSTVDDWFGQRVARDAERAERDLEDAPGAAVDDTVSPTVPEPSEPA